MPILRSGKWYSENRERPEIVKKRGRKVGKTLETRGRNRTNLGRRRLNFNMADFSFGDFNKKVPTFGGDHNGLDRFITCSDAMFESLSANGREEFGKNIIFKLEGSAFTLIRNANSTDWTVLKTKLTEKFDKKRSMAFLQKDLIELKQGYKEPVSDFADRIEKCLDEMDRASTEIKVENAHAQPHFKLWHEKLALRAFQDGLREPLRLLIKARNYENLREAIDGAI